MALNPIIEAFITASEQAARDFNNSENRKFQAEQQKELFKQQTDLQRVNLAQEKAIADARQRIAEAELKQRDIFGKQSHNLEAARTATEMITKGLVKPTITGLVGNENAPVGQIGQMDQMLNQIPEQAPQTGTVPNVPAFSPLFAGDENFTKQFLGAVTPYEQVQEQELQQKAMLQDLKDAEFMFQQRVKDQSAEKLEGIRNTGRLGVAREQGKSRAEIASLDRDAANARNSETNRVRLQIASARLASKIKSDGGADVPIQDLNNFIDGTFSTKELALYPSKERLRIIKGMDAQGYKPLTPTDQTALSRMGVINQTVRNAERLAELYNDGYRKNAAEIHTLTSSINAVLGNVSRGVAGEKGVLTQPDIDRVRQILPSWYGSIMTDVASALGGKGYDINREKVKQLRQYTQNTYGPIFHGKHPEQANILMFKNNAEGLYTPPKIQLRATPPE